MLCVPEAQGSWPPGSLTRTRTIAGFGDDFLADFLVDKIVVRKGIATHGGEHVGGELSLRDGF